MSSWIIIDTNTWNTFEIYQYLYTGCLNWKTPVTTESINHIDGLHEENPLNVTKDIAHQEHLFYYQAIVFSSDIRIYSSLSARKLNYHQSPLCPFEMFDEAASS